MVVEAIVSGSSLLGFVLCLCITMMDLFNLLLEKFITQRSNRLLSYIHWSVLLVQRWKLRNHVWCQERIFLHCQCMCILLSSLRSENSYLDPLPQARRTPSATALRLDHLLLFPATLLETTSYRCAMLRSTQGTVELPHDCVYLARIEQVAASTASQDSGAPSWG